MQTKKPSPYKSTLFCFGKFLDFYSLSKLAEEKQANLERLPYSIRVLLEGCLRHQGHPGYSEQHVDWLLGWQPDGKIERQPIPFLPARILMQDFTGLPVLNDLSALRAALKRAGKDPQIANPHTPTDLVIDHSISVEAYGCPEAQRINEEKEFQQNQERYQFLKWSQKAFNNLRVFPPGLGICHQVNLEYLGKVAFTGDTEGSDVVYPDSVLGTDSHTTMINGLGIAGWGVGGIEALAAMLGYPSEFPIPDVIGIELVGELSMNATATDLTLTITSRLREMGVVGKFAEIFGEGYASLPVETRSMIANMSPESGATMTYCPVDRQTLTFLERTGRPAEHIELVETYFKAQGLFIDPRSPHPAYSQILTIDLSQIEPSLAGPKRPQDIFALSKAKETFKKSLLAAKDARGFGLDESETSRSVKVTIQGKAYELKHGAVILAAITSCTNTSDPGVMIAAGLLARNAAQKGLRSKPWVKTSFAPGSRVVSTYLKQNSLLTDLESLGFHVVGYGCTTCIGNSGPLPEEISQAIHTNQLIGAAVLSGNRNFEGRIHPNVRASYLASPPMVVAYALAGSLDFDFNSQPMGEDQNGKPVFLKDIYPKKKEVLELVNRAITAEIYAQNYNQILCSNPRWNEMDAPASTLYTWDSSSSILKEPDFLLADERKAGTAMDISDAYALAVLGDSITTDHISPAGRIAPDNPAGKYLRSLGVKPQDFISFGARRGNHEVMVRGTFSNPRLHNLMADDQEGGFTRHIPSGEIMSIFDAALRYQNEGQSLIILAGKAYGSGSSRDWAAKGTYLLGVRAVIAESYERIHRTNLACMGILPLQFMPGENVQSLGLHRDESFSISGIKGLHELKTTLTISAKSRDGKQIRFHAIARIDTPLEMEYFQAGGLMRKIFADL